MSTKSTVDSVVGGSRQIARIATVLGAVDSVKSSYANRPSTLGEFVEKVRATAPPDVKDGPLTGVGAAAGFALWKKHRYLGLWAGGSLGRNVPALMSPELRPIALANMGQSAAAVLASLSVPDHPKMAFLLAYIASGVAIYFAKVR